MLHHQKHHCISHSTRCLLCSSRSGKKDRHRRSHQVNVSLSLNLDLDLDSISVSDSEPELDPGQHHITSPKHFRHYVHTSEEFLFNALVSYAKILVNILDQPSLMMPAARCRRRLVSKARLLAAIGNWQRQQQQQHQQSHHRQTTSTSLA
ncbi:hypothetical protein ACLKA7_014775 [Drosophila subpalustris]